ncbi:Hsp20/alpha crystallin family protein [Lyngbya sp. PCC 8106]|uniref:Hsp20/alpha crystallin family protein n=1 Tax=Lyngbya sp. (strain PCC 8106) TaxID=313612 RepID=UPI0012EA0917|nr:Hsp20/alpha crystallin family protein [Lyngbya sp. PCC 8106]
MKPKNICTVEFPVDEFRRVIALPKAIINTEVKADYTNEILTLIFTQSTGRSQSDRQGKFNGNPST